MSQGAEHRDAGVVFTRVSWAPEGGVDVLHDLSVSFGLRKYGLVGRNGAGKTTLCRMIIGELEPVNGRVAVGCTLGYLPQHPLVQDQSTVAALLGIEDTREILNKVRIGELEPQSSSGLAAKWDIESRARRALNELGLTQIGFERHVDTLSGGELTRALIARLLLDRPQMLVLDEPMNNLDRTARSHVTQVVADWRGGAVVVSHDRKLLDVMDSIVEVGRGNVSVYGGNYSAYEVQRSHEEQAAARQVSAAKQEVKREKRAAQRALERQDRKRGQGRRDREKSGQAKIILGVWREQSEKTASRSRETHQKRMAQAQDRLAEARKRIRPDNRLNLEIPTVALPAGKMVLEARDVSFAYSPALPAIIDHFEVRISGPERVGIQGPNGAGKTTFAKLIVGELNPSSGTLRLGVNGVGYVPQSTSSLGRKASVLDAFMRISGVGEKDARQALSTLLFRGDEVFKSVDDLSGGERIRLALGGELYRSRTPELLVLDEPTNHLDLDSIEQITSALQQFSGAIIVVSHDTRFLEDIGVEREIELHPPNATPE